MGIESSIKFKNGYIKTVTPGAKYTMTSTVQEIIKAMRNLHQEEWDLFRRKFGFGLEEMEAIGIEKYIKALDWNNRNQITSWKTDKLHFMICPNCKNNFGIWEHHAGLCEACKDDFFHELLEGLTPLISMDDDDALREGKFMFMSDVRLREILKKKSHDFKEAVKLSCDDSELVPLLITQSVLHDIAYVAIGEQNDADKGLAYLKTFPKRKIEPVMEQHLLTKGVKLKRDLPDQYEFTKTYIERFRIIGEEDGLEIYDLLEGTLTLDAEINKLLIALYDKN